MEEAPAPIVGGDEGKSSFCSLCGDVGFREALLPCRARGCSRLQHTYCGRYCPEMMDDAGRWRCEWCAWKLSNERRGEDEESGRKRARRAPPSSSSPEMIKQASPERPIDKDRSRESSLTAGRANPPPSACTSGPDNTNITNASVEITSAQNYTILSEHDIIRLQTEDINGVSQVLSISRDDACILLRHYKWCVIRANEEWFADEESVRKAVGLLEKPMEMPNSRELTCGICFELHPRDRLRSASCGHPFCRSCWEGYIGTSINDGPGCLMLRCPDRDCGVAVGQAMVNVVATEEDKKKYGRYLLRSYIEDNGKKKWCPAPGCEFAIDFILGSGSYDVTCKCSHNFCWNCTEEAHRPVDCRTVERWNLKSSKEPENLNWIFANSKPCPGCKQPIEKNLGYMRITCPLCKFKLCWLCLGPWSDHGERTGGFYACNRYEPEKQEGLNDETEKRGEMAKNSLEKYTYYYERWAANQSSTQKALSDLQYLQAGPLEKLSDKQSQPESQLNFIIEAWLQIVECRRVLKWTYAYGYYLPENEYAKREFFEYLQGEAESGLERLHQCAEKELQAFIVAEGPSKEFNDFRTKLAGLTSVTRNYFENLLRALEDGLNDVGSSNYPATISRAKSGKNKAARSAASWSRGPGRSFPYDGSH